MPAIEVENLTKIYKLGGLRHGSLRDIVGGLFRRVERPAEELLTALDHVSFAVAEGERVGIVGRNGSGKSTLLKILSRITKPTSGRASIAGRVGSLLEVGTGFHNELTGRENIYMNGAVLGMKRLEIDARFDEIVAFSEIEKFLDTPVKHYSSGMYMRLAFSIAAHLEPEVLIVDEVLAVGDSAFQKKCLGKMREAGESGRTVLFVSHDMSAITRLCPRAIWIRDGKLAYDGDSGDAVGEYLHHQSQTGAERVWHGDGTPGSSIARLRSMRVLNADGEVSGSFDIRRPLSIEIGYEVLEAGYAMVPGIQLFNSVGQCVFASYDWYSGWRDRQRTMGQYLSRVTVPGDLLSEGPIFVTASLSSILPPAVHFSVPDTVTFNVVDSGADGGARGDLAGEFPGIVRPLLDWETGPG